VFHTCLLKGSASSKNHGTLKDTAWAPQVKTVVSLYESRFRQPVQIGYEAMRTIKP
jgi:hypothetical protein